MWNSVFKYSVAILIFFITISNNNLACLGNLKLVFSIFFCQMFALRIYILFFIAIALFKLIKERLY